MNDATPLASPLPERSDFLKKIPLFSILDQHGRDTIGDLLQKQSCQEGYMFFDQGDVAPMMYFVLRGSVEVSKDGKPVANLGENDYFGEVGILQDTPRNASVRAMADTIFYVLPGFLVRDLVKREPVIELFFERVLAERG